MAGRSPARFLAPLALVAVAVALLMVVTSSQNETGETPASPSNASGNRPAASPDGKTKRERKGPRRYTVKAGDTPTSIADETGVPLEEILRLNPDLDPQTLSPGERIKLRE
jgi:LysM repeat protein